MRVLKWHLEDKPQEESNLTFLLASPLQSSSLSIPSQKNATSFKWTSPAKEEEEKEGLLVKFNKIGDFFYLSGTSRQNGKSSDQQIGEILAKVKGTLNNQFPPFLISRLLLLSSSPLFLPFLSSPFYFFSSLFP